MEPVRRRSKPNLGTRKPSDALKWMRRDWDARAAEDYRFFIASGHAGSEKAFRESGWNEVEHVILDGIALDPEATVLEIGCGVGRLLLPFARRVAQVYGVDISAQMIARAHEFCSSTPNLTPSVTDGTLVGFQDSSIDFIFSYIVFQHIPEAPPIAEYLRESARVLRPGGIIRFQVDGRAHLMERTNWTPNTYDGIKLSATQLRRLVADAGLEILEEWGIDTHYYWLTARTQGTNMCVQFRPRTFDRPVLADVLRRVGANRLEERANRILSGTESLRQAVSCLETSLAAVNHEHFVTEVYLRILGRPPDISSLTFHVRNLRSERLGEDRAEFLDSFLMGSVVRDLVFPALPPIPWYRREHILEKLVNRGVHITATTPVLEITDRIASVVLTMSVKEAVEFCFDVILGRRPDADTIRHYGHLITTSPFGQRLLIREVLAAQPDRPTPEPPLPAQVLGLISRLRLLQATPTTTAEGESFPGEAWIARHLLGEGAKDDCRSFIHRVYQGILGRPAEIEGERFYGRQLEAGTLSRPYLLRELLWCEELRRA